MRLVFLFVWPTSPATFPPRHFEFHHEHRRHCDDGQQVELQARPEIYEAIEGSGRALRVGFSLNCHACGDAQHNPPAVGCAARDHALGEVQKY